MCTHNIYIRSYAFKFTQVSPKHVYCIITDAHNCYILNYSIDNITQKYLAN